MRHVEDMVDLWDGQILGLGSVFNHFSILVFIFLGFLPTRYLGQRFKIGHL